jgi:hypothetical protein
MTVPAPAEAEAATITANAEAVPETEADTATEPEMAQASPSPVATGTATSVPPPSAASPAVGTVVPASSQAPAQAVDEGSISLRAWHFAEGNSRNGFETYFTLLNLSDKSAGVTANYNRDDGIRLTQWIGIEPHARLSLNANDVVGAKAFGSSFFSDQDIVVERTTIWGPGQNGETTVGFAPDGKKRWYFAEGTTRGHATTYFVTQNLSDAPTVVTATFVSDSGKPAQRQFTMAPRARDAYRVNDLLQDTAFSASFRSDQDIVVERTIMTEGERPPTVSRGRTGDPKREKGNGQTDDSFAMARDAVGIFGGLGFVGNGTEPGLRNWEFAEGSTREPYRTTFVLFNPGQQGVEARFTFRIENGGTRTQKIQVPGLSRAAFDPRDLVPGADFATSISADRPIIAERAYASSGDGLYGALGFTSTASRADARSWYFAEGNTSNQIEAFFVLFNLSEKDTQVRGTYFIDGARPREQTLNVPAGKRLAIRANDVIDGGFFATRFVADQNIMVERTLYLPGGSGYTTVGSGAGRP